MNTIIYKADGQLMGSMPEREDDKIFRIMVKRGENDFVVASYVSGNREWFGGHYFHGPDAFNRAKGRFMYDLMEVMPMQSITEHPKAFEMVRKLFEFLTKLEADKIYGTPAHAGSSDVA